MRENGLSRVVQNLTEKIFKPLGWQVRTGSESMSTITEKLEVDTGRRIFQVNVEYKAALLDVVSRHKQNENTFMVFGTNHVGRTMLERFKAQNVSVIDEAGNYFFSYQHGKERVWLYEFGHKSETKRPPRIDAFSPKASFVAMALLHADNFEIPTMRDLQEATKVSLGGLNAICKAMREHNLIDYSRSEPIRITDPKRFLDEYAIYYKLRLVPKLQRKGYIAVRKKKLDKDTKELSVTPAHWKEVAQVLQASLSNFALSGVQAAQSESTFYAIDIGEFLTDDIKTAEMLLREHFQISPTVHRPDFYLISPYNSSAFMNMNDKDALRKANRVQIYLDLISSEDQRANELGTMFRENAFGY